MPTHHPAGRARSPRAAKHDHVNHEEFILKETKSEYVLVDRRGRGKDVLIQFHWDGMSGEYTVQITRDPKARPRPYSLYNICVQNRNWGSHIKVPRAQRGVMFLDGEGRRLKPDRQGEYAIPYTGWVSPTNPSPQPDAICFVSFKGPTCSFVIRSDRIMAGAPMPTSPSATSHDSLPPPPESGNEN